MTKAKEETDKKQSLDEIIKDTRERTKAKSIEEKKKKEYVNQPRDENGNVYTNEPRKRHHSLKHNTKKAARAAGIKEGWDMTGREFLNRDKFEEIPDSTVRIMAQKIKDGIPRRIAARACGVVENLAEFWIDKGLGYVDRVMTDDGVVERKTYLKDLILISEAQQEENARMSIMIAMKKGNLKATQQFMDKQKELEEKFLDRAEYRQIAKDMGLSKKDYIRCLNVLNGVTQQQASLNVGRSKNMNMYHYRMNPAVKDFIKEIKRQRVQEMLDNVPFSKETAQFGIQYAMSTLIEEMEKPNNTKQDIINIAKEIRNTAETMWKATSMFPKEDAPVSTTNIAILAWENTDAVLNILGRKHDTKALNITQFANGQNTQSSTSGTTSPMTDGGATTEPEGTMSE